MPSRLRVRSRLRASSRLRVRSTPRVPSTPARVTPRAAMTPRVRSTPRAATTPRVRSRPDVPRQMRVRSTVAARPRAVRAAPPSTDMPSRQTSARIPARATRAWPHLAASISQFRWSPATPRVVSAAPSPATSPRPRPATMATLAGPPRADRVRAPLAVTPRRAGLRTADRRVAAATPSRLPAHGPCRTHARAIAAVPTRPFRASGPGDGTTAVPSSRPSSRPSRRP